MKCAWFLCEHTCTSSVVFNDDDRITLETVVSNHPWLADGVWFARRRIKRPNASYFFQYFRGLQCERVWECVWERERECERESVCVCERENYHVVWGWGWFYLLPLPCSLYVWPPTLSSHPGRVSPACPPLPVEMVVPWPALSSIRIMIEICNPVALHIATLVSCLFVFGIVEVPGASCSIIAWHGIFL